MRVEFRLPVLGDRHLSLDFRLPPLGAAQLPDPAEDELHIRPAGGEDSGRRDLALMVLEEGLDALAKGGGKVECIVVQRDPTLDDLLATSFAIRLLRGGTIPEAAKAFGKYAALVREGLHPGKVPLEQSLEGIFLALRNRVGENLEDEAIGKAFVQDCAKMAEVVFGAIDAGKDPFTEPLFDGEEFSRERAFLENDKQVFSQDVQRGERWHIKIPGGPERGSGLLLRNPKSLLFKHWSRRGIEAPEGGTFLFMAVLTDPPGSWIFSTDPVQRLAIKGLWEELQRMEDASSGGGTPAKWFSGEPFGFTLVASPSSGSKLSQKDVLKAVKKWLGAKRVSGRKISLVKAGFLAAASLAIILVTVASIKILTMKIPLGVAFEQAAYLAKPSIAANVNFRARGMALAEDQIPAVKDEVKGFQSYAIIVGVGKSSFGPRLPAACKDASKFYCLLRDGFGYPPQNMRLLVDEPEVAKDPSGRALDVYAAPDYMSLERAIEELAEVTNRAQAGSINSFVFYFAGHGDRLDKEKKKSAKTIGYLVLSGYWENRDNPANMRGFEMGYLSKHISDMIGASHQLLLVDCCFSGLAAVPRGALAGDGRIFQFWKKRANVVITAATDKEQAFEEESGQSFFAKTLMCGLGADSQGPLPADLNMDGIVTDEELGAYVQDQVPKVGNVPQNPMHFRGLEGDDVGQFLFVPSANKGR